MKLHITIVRFIRIMSFVIVLVRYKREWIKTYDNRMKYVGCKEKMVKVFWSMSKHFHINYKLNYIAISMKQENGSSKRSIKIMDYEDVDCLISLFQ